MKAKFALFLLSLSTCLLAQTESIFNFNRSLDRNSISSFDCKINHQRILYHYKSQLYSELSRLMVGIEIEKRNKVSKDLSILKEKSTDLVIKILLTENLYEQAHARSFNLEPIFNSLPKKTFTTKNITISIQKKIYEVLSNANVLIQNKTYSLTHQALHDFEHHIKTDIFKHLALEAIEKTSQETIKRIITGIAIRETIYDLTPATLRQVTFHFSKDLLVSAARGTVLTLITYPFHAYTYSHEVQWIRALLDFPELVINPDWMTELKIYGNPIRNHCYAIDRHPVIFSKILEKLIDREEKQFLVTVKKYMNSSALDTINLPKIDVPADATYIDGYRYKNHVEKLPKWTKINQ